MPVVEIAQTIDARGLSCPMPIVKTAQAIKGLPAGSIVELLATDAGSIKALRRWEQAAQPLRRCAMTFRFSSREAVPATKRFRASISLARVSFGIA